MQGAVQAGKVLRRKVKGTENPGNFLTKHAQTGKEMQEALLSFGMLGLKTVAGATALQKHSVKTVRINRATKAQTVPDWDTTALQILGIKAQGPQDYEGPWEQILNGIILLGLLTGLFLIRNIVVHSKVLPQAVLKPPRPQNLKVSLTDEEDEILPQEVGHGDEIPVAENQPDEDPSEEEEQEQPAEAPAPQVWAPPLKDYRPPAPEPEPVDQEPVPQQPAPAAAAAAAAPPVPPQGRY